MTNSMSRTRFKRKISVDFGLESARRISYSLRRWIFQFNGDLFKDNSLPANVHIVKWLPQQDLLGIEHLLSPSLASLLQIKVFLRSP